MSVVTWIPRKSRLSSMIDEPGGLSVGVAVAQAEANLDSLQAQSQTIVAECIEQLSTLQPPATVEETPQRLEQAYRHASSVIDAASPFERDDLCSAAAGLCDLLDAAPKGKAFDWRIVTVHAQALKLLLSLPRHATEARKQVLDNLFQVVELKLGGRQPAA
jgi:hypothetical protein